MKFDWIIAQTWLHTIFLNYKVDPKFFEGRLPEGIELDTYNGSAYLTVVPFRMEGIRFPFTPPLPFSSLWELNLRTYVKAGGKSGIYFLTLDTDHLLSEWIAQTFFYLPYRFKSMRAHIQNQDYIFDAGDSFFMKAKVTSVPLVTESYHYWLMERYSVFTHNGSDIWRGDVIHEPWPLKYVKIETLREGLCNEFFPTAPVELESVFYCEKMPVSFRPFQRL